MNCLNIPLILFLSIANYNIDLILDSVNHTILIAKLEYNGVRGCVNNWFKSYLSGRTQTIEVDGDINVKEINPFGVPQGSVLGPLLFLYINDIIKSTNNLNFFFFVNDTFLLYVHKNLNYLEAMMNNEL